MQNGSASFRKGKTSLTCFSFYGATHQILGSHLLLFLIL